MVTFRLANRSSSIPFENGCPCTVRHYHLLGFCFMAFFDIEKPYDTAWRYEILQALNSFGLRSHLLLFVQVFLRDCTFRDSVFAALSCILHRKRVFLKAASSVPPPLPWLSMASPVLFPRMFVVLYVDEFFHLLCIFPSRCGRVQHSIGYEPCQSLERGFNFSPTKTFAMHFSRLKGVFLDSDLYLYGRYFRW